jgi:2-keto-4-pentenoate hydratase/2-oxohepta-3-ene-1,7-dioic acid hydratase in catechol pathway
MHIYRFIDESGTTRYGTDLRDGSAEVLTGDHPAALTPTATRSKVRKLLCPIEPTAILGIGLNYRGHAAETQQPIPERVVLFMKNPASVQNPGDPIILPKFAVERPEVDYEGELAVVIGCRARNVPASQALDYVLGYTIGNDVSARRVQKHGGAGQWVRGKSYDTFCPLGPAIVTPDQIPDPQKLALTTRLNGQVMQESSTSDMIFGVAEIIADLSAGMTLLPGTLILTGTPAGVGFTRVPPAYLCPGDRVSVTIEGIGMLDNPVEAESGSCVRQDNRGGP